MKTKAQTNCCKKCKSWRQHERVVVSRPVEKSVLVSVIVNLINKRNP